MTRYMLSWLGVSSRHLILLIAVAWLAVSCSTGQDLSLRPEPSPPSICDQIRDHINAYIVYTGCEQPGGEIGFFPVVARREPISANCTTPSNGVARLPYRAPRVDDAVYAVLESELQGPLKLRATIDTFWLSRSAKRDSRREVEDRIRRELWQVPFLYGRLQEQVLVRLGEDTSCPTGTGETIVDADTIRPALERMRFGTVDRDGGLRFGTFALAQEDGSPVDPVLAAAIVQAQRMGMTDVPTVQEVEDALRRIGATLSTSTRSAQSP